MALKILLADDSMTAQNMGKKILTDAGYEVVAVSNGAAAVKKLPEIKPDIILLDVYMPGYSGLEVCERVKGSPNTARIPVLLTVGKLEPFRPEDGMKARADGLIIKPFEASDLIAVVGKLAERVVAAPPIAPLAAVAAEPASEVETEISPAETAVEIPEGYAATPALMDELEPAPAAVESAPVISGEPPSMQPPQVQAPITPGIETAVLSHLPPSAEEPVLLEPIIELEPGREVPLAATAEPGPVSAPPALVAESVPPPQEAPLEIRLEAAPEPAPEVEFTLATPVEVGPVSTLPELEPTIVHEETTEEVAPAAGLITGFEGKAGAPAAEAAVTAHRADEPPEFVLFAGEQPVEAEKHFEERLSAAMDAFDKAAAIPEERPATPPVAEPAAKVAPLESAPPLAKTKEVVEAEIAQPSYLERIFKVEAPRATAAAAPSGTAGLSDLDRALASALADAVRRQNETPAVEMPRSLDDIDEALGLVPPPPAEEEEGEEAAPEIVIPPAEERVNVSFGPDVGDAKEIVAEPEPPMPVEAPPAAPSVFAPVVPAEERVSVFPVAAVPKAVPVTAAPTSEPAPATPTQSAPIAAKTEPAKPQAREEALQSVDQALEAVNQAIAEQIVERVLHRVRPELVEEILRLLKQG